MKYIKETPRLTVKFINADTEAVLFEINDRIWKQVDPTKETYQNDFWISFAENVYNQTKNPQKILDILNEVFKDGNDTAKQMKEKILDMYIENVPNAFEEEDEDHPEEPENSPELIDCPSI